MKNQFLILILAATVITSLIITVCSTGLAWTHGPQGPPHGPPSGQDLLTEFDADGDDLISFEEFPGPADHFDKMDADNDGFLTLQELQSGRPGPPMNNGFERDDVDGDGMVSRQEFSGPQELFDDLDVDSDGYITREEADSLRPMPDPEEWDQ